MHQNVTIKDADSLNWGGDAEACAVVECPYGHSEGEEWKTVNNCNHKSIPFSSQSVYITSQVSSLTVYKSICQKQSAEMRE